MAKSVSQTIIDTALNAIKNGANRLVICAGQPTSYADVTTRRLAEVAVAAVDFTLANGDVSGRKVSIAAKSGIAISASGSADHVVWANSTDSSTPVVATCTTQALSTGGGATVDVPSHKYEINQPT